MSTWVFDLKELISIVKSAWSKTGLIGAPEQGESRPGTPGNGLLKTIWLEWGFIVLAIWVYCLTFLDLGSSASLPGPEADYFQSFDQILRSSIKEQGQFPLWNSYYFTGTPYAAHPMLHAYNPFVSLPVMLFGALAGFKIAVFFGFIVAGLGMWWLGKEFGLGPVGRIWIGLIYAFSGVPTAKFIQGHYLMVLAFGWMPFSLAAMHAATRSRRWFHICVASVGLALLFLCGNVYYAYYMLYVIMLYTIISIVTLEKRPGNPQFDRKDFGILVLTGCLVFGCLAVLGLVVLYFTDNFYYTYYWLFAIALFSLVALTKHPRSPIRLKIDRADVKVLLAIGALSLGLIAVQLLPSLEYRNQYTKTTDPELTDSRTVKDVFLDFVSPDPFRPGAFSPQLRPEEFYAYIGWWPFAGLLLLPLAWNKQNKRNILFLLSLVVFTFLWIDVKDMPWRSLFQTLPLLYQFRFPSRMVVVGAMALITTGGLGLDSLWKALQKFKDTQPGATRRRLTGTLSTGALGIFLLCSTGNLAVTTRPLLQTSPSRASQETIAEWLRKFDPGIYYVSAPNGWDRALIGNQLRYLDGGYAIHYLLRYDDRIGTRGIEVGPKYAIRPSGTPVQTGAVPVKSFGDINVYRMTASLPFAFTTSRDILTSAAGTSLTAQELTPETFVAVNVNTLEGTVTDSSNKILVLLSTFTPDWQLAIDGAPAKIYSVAGYMAAEVSPGTHDYAFVFRPLWFFVGLAISIATLLAMFIILIVDLLGPLRGSKDAVRCRA